MILQLKKKRVEGEIKFLSQTGTEDLTWDGSDPPDKLATETFLPVLMFNGT